MSCDATRYSYKTKIQPKFNNASSRMTPQSLIKHNDGIDTNTARRCSEDFFHFHSIIIENNTLLVTRMFSRNLRNPRNPRNLPKQTRQTNECIPGVSVESSAPSTSSLLRQARRHGILSTRRHYNYHLELPVLE